MKHQIITTKDFIFRPWPWPFVSLLFGLAMAHALSAEPVRFIPITPENTTLADGAPLDLKAGDWKWLPEEGNGGIMESYGDPKRNAPTLVVEAKGLEPGRDYEVFGFFWTHGFGKAPASRGKQPHHWPARFGTGLATLTTYGGKTHAQVPWIICPESKSGIHFGYTAALEEKNPLVKDVSGWITAVDDTRLIRARAGISRTDKDGNLPVYVDDFPDSKFCGHTRIDGIGLRLLPAGEHDSTGAGKPGHLHLAVRAGDHHNMRRELAAGADVNALDEDGVTPLLYPATAGDQDTVRELIKAGANPNQSGQSILPLTGAASWGDAEMVKLLLDAGAKVPLKLQPRSPLLNEQLDPARLHPAIAAIRAGSPGSLRLLFEHQPDLDLKALKLDMDKGGMMQHWEAHEDMVGNTIRLAHDELAAFLIQKGCPINDARLLKDCVELGEQMAKTREALLMHGVPPVQRCPYSSRYADPIHHHKFVKPWDALSAAVFIGDAVLTKRFLPSAKDSDPGYRFALHALADCCGKKEILDLIRQAFPNRSVPVESIPSGGQTMAEEEGGEARLFLPRTGKSAQDSGEGAGTWNLAVIAAPAAAGAASLIETRASISDRWRVLDRALIEAALQEDRHTKPWEKGEHRLSELGDRLTADVILVVTKLAGGDIQLLRFEAVDVLSGLVIDRQYLEEKAGADDKMVASLLQGVESALARARASKQAMAVSLLTFTAEKGIPSSVSLAREFRAAMEIEVDATPGLLSVGMSEIDAIVREQSLKGEGAFWAAAFTLEGGIARMADGRVSVTIRLRNLAGQSERSMDAVAVGQPGGISSLVSQAWSQLLKAREFPSSATRQAKPDAKRASLEAARLIREAEWLARCGRYADARPIAERAAILGASPETMLPILFACLLHELPIQQSGILQQWGMNYHVPVDSCLSLHAQQGMIQHLEVFSDLLDRTVELHRKHGHDAMRWRRNRDLFWTLMQTLWYARAVIPPHLLSTEQAQQFDDFSRGLDEFTPEYFNSEIAGMHKLDDTLYLFQELNKEHPGTAMMYIRNPGMSDGISLAFIAFVDSPRVPFRYFLDGRRSSGFTTATDIACRELEKHIDKLAKDPRRALQLQIQFTRARGDEVPLLARSCQREVLRSGRLSYLSENHAYISFVDNDRYGLREFFRIRMDGFAPRENHVLHALFHNPGDVPECLARSGYLQDDRWSDQRDLLALEKTNSLRNYHGSFPSSLINMQKQQLHEALHDSASTGRMNELVRRNAHFDLLFGRDIHQPVANEWKKLSAMPSRSQVLAPRLITDLRNCPDPTPGIFDLWARDISEPNRLWLRYHPHEEGLCRTDGNMMWAGKTKQRGAWLLAVDPASGKIRQSIGLSGFGELKDNHVTGISMRGSGSSFLAQNSSSFLTPVEWRNAGNPKENRAAYALIEKSTGKHRMLLKGMRIKMFDGYPRHQAACIEVMGEDFFFLADKDLESFRGESCELVRMNSTGQTEFLSKIGRRPELSPFDSEDRCPNGLVTEKDQLLVYNSQIDHLATYDPKLRKWSAVADGDRNKYVRSDQAIEIAARQKTIEVRTVRMPGGKHQLVIRGDEGIWPKSMIYFPSLLSIDLPGKKNVEVPLKFDFPEDYHKTARFIDEGGHRISNKLIPDRFLTLDQLVSEKRIHPVVLSQTAEDLVVALRIKPGKDSVSFGENEAFLPFLWSVSKQELFVFLKISP